VSAQSTWTVDPIYSTWTVDPIYSCWLWTGRTDKRDGRAIVWRGKSPYAAQRAVYEQEVGPIPEGMELDHLCRRPHCVAPHHAEPVTRGENEKRKALRHRMKWKCPKGHGWPINRATTDVGGVTCRTCNREARATT
jgi:hypothetical protein